MNYPLITFSCESKVDCRSFSCLLCEIDPYSILLEIGAEDEILSSDDPILQPSLENRCKIIFNGTKPGPVAIET